MMSLSTLYENKRSCVPYAEGLKMLRKILLRKEMKEWKCFAFSYSAGFLYFCLKVSLYHSVGKV